MEFFRHLELWEGLLDIDEDNKPIFTVENEAGFAFRPENADKLASDFRALLDKIQVEFVKFKYRQPLVEQVWISRNLQLDFLQGTEFEIILSQIWQAEHEANLQDLEHTVVEQVDQEDYQGDQGGQRREQEEQPSQIEQENDAHFTTSQEQPSQVVTGSAVNVLNVDADPQAQVDPREVIFNNVARPQESTGFNAAVSHNLVLMLLLVVSQRRLGEGFRGSKLG